MHNQNFHSILEIDKDHRRLAANAVRIISFVELRIGFPPKQQVEEDSAANDAYHQTNRNFIRIDEYPT